MFKVGEYWNPRQAMLKQKLKEGNMEEAKAALNELHSAVHTSEVYESNLPSFMDEIWEGLSEKAFRIMSSADAETIAWDIWHITRIEDLTVNILIADSKQVFDESGRIGLIQVLKIQGMQ